MPPAPLPSYNVAEQALLEGRATPEHLRELERELVALQTHFNYELRFAEETPLLVAVLPAVHSSFNLLSDLLDELKQLLEPRPQACLQLLQGQFRRRLDRLYAAFDKLRKEEQSRPRMCRSPYYEPLLRAARAFSEGRLAASLLQERLRPLLEQQQNMLVQLVQAPDGQTELRQGCELLLEGLLRLESLACEPVDQEELEFCLDEITEVVDALIDCGEELARAQQQAATRTCLACGASSPVTGRVCPACGARFPDFTTGQQLLGSTVDLSEGMATDSGQRPTLFARLLSVLERAALGEPVDELERELDSTYTRLRVTRLQLSRLPPEAGEIRGRLLAALNSFARALEQVESELAEGHSPTAALAELTRAGDDLVELTLELDGREG